MSWLSLQGGNVEDDDGGYLVLEDGSDVEVSFARRARGRGRHRRWWVAGLGVAGIVAVAAAVTSGDDDGASSSADGASSTTLVVPSSATPDPTATGPRLSSEATTTVYLPPSQFGVDPGWRVYVSGNLNEDSVFVVDVTTGQVTWTDRPGGASSVVRGTDGRPQIVPMWGTPSAPVGDGTAWRLRSSDPDSANHLVRVSLADGSELETFTIAATSGWTKGLLGTWTDGRPVVELRDHRPYVVGVDGTLSRLVDADVESGMTPDRYLASECDSAGLCRALLHSGSAVSDVTVDGTVDRVAFSPDGSLAATVERNQAITMLRIWRVGVGQLGDSHPIKVESGMPWSAQGWSPDGRYFFWADGTTLRVFDTATATVSDLPLQLPSDVSVVGVA